MEFVFAMGPQGGPWSAVWAAEALHLTVTCPNWYSTPIFTEGKGYNCLGHMANKMGVEPEGHSHPGEPDTHTGHKEQRKALPLCSQG